MAASHSERGVLHWREVLVVPPQRRRRREGGELAERREADEGEDERAHGYAVRLRARVVAACWRCQSVLCGALFGFARACGGVLQQEL